MLRLDVVVLDVGHDQPDRRIDAGIERHDHAGHAELARDAAGMHRPGAAEGEQHEIAQVVPAHGGDRLDRLLHLHVDDADDAFGRSRHAHAKRARDLVLDRRARRGDVEPHPAAQEIVLAQVAEHEVAVGDGRHLAAAAVAGRPRHRAGAFRADLEHAEAVDAGDGAAAGADGVDVHHRHREVAALDLAAAGDRGLAVLDQRHVAGGAAHVEGDEVLETGHPARIGAGGDAAGRAGQHGGHCLARGARRTSPCRRSTA